MAGVKAERLGKTPRRVWPSSIACALTVDTPQPIGRFACPVCCGAVRTRPDRHGRADVDFDWVCHRCGAHGAVHAADATLSVRTV